MRALLLALVATVTLQAQPRSHTFTLPNGLRVVHLEDRERPLVRVSLLLRVLPSDTPPGRPGLALLAGRMLTGPGGPRTEAMDRELEAAGIRLDTTSAPEGLTWKLAARNREQDRAMGLLAELVLRPILNPQHLAACRADCLRDLFKPGANPADRLRETLAWDPADRPTEASLLAIGPEDLGTFQQRVFRPGCQRRRLPQEPRVLLRRPADRRVRRRAHHPRRHGGRLPLALGPTVAALHHTTPPHIASEIVAQRSQILQWF